MIGAILRDLRYTARGLVRSPGFTLVAVLTLGLGIGTTTAVFSVVYGVIFRPLAFPTADRLVQIIQVVQRRGGEPSRQGLTPEQIQGLRMSARTVSAISFSDASLVGGAMTGGPDQVRLAGVRVSASLFETLGVRPLLGRGFTEDEERPAPGAPRLGGARVVVLSYATWRGYFGGDSGVVDRLVTLNDRPHRIVGVMPEGFSFPSIAAPDALTSRAALADAPEYWMPLALPASNANGYMPAETYALLNDGYSRQAAIAELSAILPPLPGGRQRSGVEVINLRDETSRSAQPVLWMFQSAVALVLLIACLNIVNLLRSRAVHRRHELWVRLSLGASRAGLLRHALMESLLLACTGGALGAALAYGLTAAVRMLPPHVLPRIRDVQVDTPVLLFVAAVSIASGIAVGGLAAFRASTRPMLTASRATTRQPSRSLVVIQVAAGVLLLVSGGLLLSSSRNLTGVDLGVDPQGVLVFRVSVPSSRFAGLGAQEALYERATAALRGIPTVEAAGVTGDGSVIERGATGQPLVVDGVDRGDVAHRYVSPGYFEALRIPVGRGRTFTSADRGEPPRTVIVSEALARKHFGRLDVVGRRVTFQEYSDLEIVGVVGDVRVSTEPDAPAQTGAPLAQMYFPWPALAGVRAVGLVRTSGDPRAIAPSVRAALTAIDPGLVVYDVQPLADRMARATVTSRFYAVVSNGFAWLAVLLAAVGQYGLLAFSVGVRTREFGIRAALGAAPAVLLSGVMREGLAITAAGIALGLAAALYASRFLQAMLFGITPRDTITFAAVTLMFATIGAVACYIPARRATRVDPVVALRAE
jgi:predicted permease